MRYKTPQDLRTESIAELVATILGEDIATLKIEKIAIEEFLLEGKTKIVCEVQHSERTLHIQGEGRGVVDALFGGMTRALAKDYRSLEGIEFIDFLVSIDPQGRGKKSGTDSYVNVDIQLQNSSKSRMHFSSRSRSMISAAINASLLALEYFINCERAVLKTYDAIQRCEKHNMPETKEKYVDRLTRLVENTSYEKTIAEYKGDIN